MGSQTFHCFPLASLGVFYVLSLNMKVSLWSEQPYGTLAPVPNLPSLTVPSGDPDPHLFATLPLITLSHMNLFHFLPRPELSGLWAFVYIGPLAEDFLESPASPAPGSHPR